MRINHNISAINAQNQLVTNQRSTEGALAKLSSGLRINNAGDDAAGLSISEKMRSQIRGLDRAELNAQDGISMIQTADGALQEVSDILQRMRELSVQATNGILSKTEKDAIKSELTQLREEIDRISESITFNGTYLLKGTLGMTADKTTSEDTLYTVKDGETVLLASIESLDVSGAEADKEYEIDVTSGEITLTYTGADGNAVAAKSTTGKFADNDQKYTGFMRFELADGTNAGIKLQVKDMKVGDLEGKKIKTTTGGSTKLQIGANSIDRSIKITIPDLRSKALNLSELKIDTVAEANDTLDYVDNAVNTLNAARGSLGAYQNRLEYTIDALAASSENLTAAESRIRDVDMAAEMVKYTSANVINQSATAMLAQANQLPQQVLTLLQGL